MTNKIAWLLKDLDSVPKNGKKVFSTFSGGGGSSLGYKLAGYECLGGCDIDPRMMQAYVKNLTPKYSFVCPVKDLIEKDLPKEFFDLDILDGSPPCSTFSTVGKREKDWGVERKFTEGQQKQVLSNLFFDFLDLVKKLKPKIVVAENVKGLLAGRAVGYVKKIFEVLTSLGYETQIFLVNAANCGVPQARERVFFVSRKKSLCLPNLVFQPKHKWVSAEKAIQDIDFETENKKEKLLLNPNERKKMYNLWLNTNPGASFVYAHKKLYGKKSFWIWVKQNEKLPFRTVLSDSRLFRQHIFGFYSFLEMKRASSFPDDYEAENPTHGKYILGMSVPPKMISCLAKEINTQWLKKFKDSKNEN